MTTNINEDVINHCEACELDYVGRRGAPCPLCPLRRKHEEKTGEVTKVERYRIVDDADRLKLQGRLNELATSAWTVESFRVGHQQDAGHGCPVYVALLRRSEYDPQRHRAAVYAHLEALAASLAKRREAEVETEAFNSAREIRVDHDGC